MRKLVHGQYERAGSTHPPFPNYDGLVEMVVPDMETYMSLSKSNFLSSLYTFRGMSDEVLITQHLQAPSIRKLWHQTKLSFLIGQRRVLPSAGRRRMWKMVKA